MSLIIFVTGQESSPTNLVGLDFPGVIIFFFFFVSLVLADKADGGSFSGTTEVAEIPQFWCKLFEIKQKCQ